MKALAGTAILTFVSCAAGQTPGFHLVGFAPGGVSSGISDLSRDGTIAVGGTATQNGAVAFRWTAAGGREDFGLLPGMPSFTSASSVSDDGSVVAGSMREGFGATRAFRWAGAGLPVDLGILSGHDDAHGLDISGDGNTVLVYCRGCRGSTCWSRLALWTAQTGLQAFTGIGGYYSTTSLSRDGLTVVGGTNAGLAVKWTAAGSSALPNLTGATAPYAYAYAVNADGSVVVGTASGATQPPLGVDHPVRWTGTIVEDLGILPGYIRAHARAVSDDGSIVAGFVVRSNSEDYAAVWLPGTGAILLTDLLASRGVTVPEGWTPAEIRAISGDGLTFGGFARSTTGVRQGFVATIAGHCYPNCDNSTQAPVLNVADFICFTNKYAAADPYANCDASTVPPVINVADFICFQTRFAAGCP